MGKLIRNGIEYGGGNGTDIFEVTQAEYDALVQAGTLVHNALYVITDAQNLNPTASDIEYSGGVSVKQAIDNLDYRYAVIDLSSLSTTANTAQNLGALSTLTSNKVTSYTQIVSICMVYGAGTNYSASGSVSVNASNNVIFYPLRTDTGVSIRIVILYKPNAI